MFGIIAQFRNWCGQKAELHTGTDEPLMFRQGEIWWCSIGMNVGSELFGKGDRFLRPVLVLKKFSRTMFLGLPLTLREKQGSWFVETNVGSVRRWAILSQARTYDSRRFNNCVGEVDRETLSRILLQFVKLISS